MAEKGEEPERITTSNPSTKLSREERKKLREKKRADAGFPTKMNKYLYFVLLFTGIVTFFDGWSTMAITLAMGGFGGTLPWPHISLLPYSICSSWFTFCYHADFTFDNAILCDLDRLSVAGLIQLIDPLNLQKIIHSLPITLDTY